MGHKAPTSYFVRDGYGIILLTLVVAVLVACFYSLRWAVLPFLLACFFTFFFRNPKRTITTDPSLLVSPADGRVMSIIEEEESIYLQQKCKKITIFLSVFDVHVNRAPMEGKIVFRQYSQGGFLPAYKSNVGFENERHTVCIDNGKKQVLVTQIAGLLARRIVSWTDLGSMVQKGELYGMIKFGSCTELYVPMDVEVLVKKGQHVRGGETIIGRFTDGE